MPCETLSRSGDNPVCLIILDGYGLAEPGPSNAISLAATPCLDRIFGECCPTTLDASGEAVGLPDGQMGNSEVGHLNIGAGRVIYQELTRINKACAEGTIEDNDVIRAAFESACSAGAALHFMGLLSDGGVHSTIEHLYALLGMARRMNVPEVYIHCFMDGRDVPPTSGLTYLEQLSGFIAAHGDGECTMRIASIQGRYYGMDRDNRWDRVQKGYECIVSATPVSTATPIEYLADSYEHGTTDEFVLPAAFDDRGVRDGDSVVFFNFRPDRARQITRAFVEEEFSSFDAARRPHVNYVCLTEYDADIDTPVAFAKEFPDDVLADVVADAGLRQLHIAETEKYAHVTFFLNGGKETPKQGEQRILVNSPKVATYDLQPEMSAPEVAQKLAEALRERIADFYVVNFANCDMVGHTGIIPAAVKAVEAVDAAVELVLQAAREVGATCLVTADHGNADKMIADDGSPHTAHTTAPVPLALCDYSGRGYGLAEGRYALCDIAPTIVEILDLKKPFSMSGKSLLALTD